MRYYVLKVRDGTGRNPLLTLPLINEAPRWDIEPRQDLKSGDKPRIFNDAEPTDLYRYQESEYATGREIGVCGTYISVLIH